MPGQPNLNIVLQALGNYCEVGESLNFETFWLLSAYFCLMISDTSSSREKNAPLSVNAPS
jgi:hypothetical protein